jgi:outer membrane lipoprotein-sorting protein
MMLEQQRYLRIRGGISMVLCASLALSWSTPSLAQSTPQPMTAPQILARMAANTAALTSYQVPVHIEAHVKKGGLSLPAKMDGERYFKAPDKTALKMHGVPAIAKAFSNTYASLGTPLTWQSTFNIAYESAGTVGTHQVYTLRATYKKSSRVDHILMDVDTSTFDPVQVRWFYTNGATIAMQIEESQVGGRFRLPQRETVDAAFPEYRGNAVVTYGTYATNVPVDDSVFST